MKELQSLNEINDYFLVTKKIFHIHILITNYDLLLLEFLLIATFLVRYTYQFYLKIVIDTLCYLFICVSVKCVQLCNVQKLII